VAVDQTWRCGYALLGLPAIPAIYGPGHDLEPGEVWFAGGDDSFEALKFAFAHTRAMLDRVEEEFGVVYVWPPRADWGHLAPRWVEQEYGRQYEQRLLDVMEQEETRLSETRFPNPYEWTDPRHPREQLRRKAEALRQRRTEEERGRE
ncbi:MAG TPA: hypothetical protein VGP10_08695, partial [Marisediminicola sp.]|nr:hypothetical protein [Marisediminicola sp.]